MRLIRHLSVISANIHYALAIVLLYGIWKFRGPLNYLFRRFGRRQNTVKGTIIDPHIVLNIINYFKEFPHFSDRKINVKMGDIKAYYTDGPLIAISKNSTLTEDGDKIKFHDKNFNVQGMCSWNSATYISKKLNKDNVLIDVNKEYNYFVIEIIPTLEISNVDEYVNKTIDMMIEINSKQPTYNIQYYNVVSPTALGYLTTETKNNIRNIKTIEIKNKEKEGEEIISTIFNEHIEDIWKRCKEVHYNPNKFISRGTSAYAGYLLYGPGGTGKSSLVYKLAIALGRHIVQIDLRFVNIKGDVQYIIDYFITQKIKPIFVFDEFDKSIVEIENKHRIESDYLTYLKTSKGDDKKTDFSMALSTSSNQLTVDDFLSILQGVCPLNEAIVIATTNNIENIREYESLCRPGRLTQIEFPYLTKKIIHKMISFYFPSKDITTLNLNVDDLKIPHSAIMMLIDLADGDFTLFSEKYTQFIKNKTE